MKVASEGLAHHGNDNIRVFKSVGTDLEDLSAARLCFRKPT
jgi:ornithine cyclodeaminase/alanine dehydrogenase-like protein (mu-crystallin family)